MDDILIARLKAQHTQISRFHDLSGSPALSLGAFHDGKVIHTAHFGRRDVSKPDRPNDDSVYHVASMLKILTVSLIARLVHDRLLSWDVPIREYLPEFNREDDIGRLTTLRDLIANRTGLAVAVFFWSQQRGELVIEKSEMVRMACHIRAVKPFRSSFLYSQWNYILIQIVIERVTKISFGTLIQKLMITPLGLKHTTFDVPRGENVISPHAVRDDGTATKIEINPWTDVSGIAAGAGGKASLNDLLATYIQLLSAYNHQKAHNTDTTPGSPFTCLRTIFEPQIKARNSETRDQAYCPGLYRTILPGNLSIASWNLPLFGDKMPVFGKSLAGTEIYHHTMSIPGFLGSMFLVPHSNSGVVVISNATPKLDATDLSAQCLLGTLLNEFRPNLLRMAEMGPKMNVAIFQQIASLVERGRTSEPPSLPCHMYTGVYKHSAGNFILGVTETENGLLITVQGKSRISYELYPYDGDTFYWPVDHDKELCEKGMWPHLLPAFHVVTFVVKDGSVECLRWHHDPLDGPEDFVKDTTRPRL